MLGFPDGNMAAMMKAVESIVSARARSRRQVAQGTLDVNNMGHQRRNVSHWYDVIELIMG